MNRRKLTDDDLVIIKECAKRVKQTPRGGRSQLIREAFAEISKTNKSVKFSTVSSKIYVTVAGGQKRENKFLAQYREIPFGTDRQDGTRERFFNVLTEFIYHEARLMRSSVENETIAKKDAEIAELKNMLRDLKEIRSAVERFQTQR